MRHLRQVVGFGGPMGLGKREQLGIAAPLRHSLNAFVNANSTRLTRMVRTQFAKKVSGQGGVSQIQEHKGFVCESMALEVIATDRHTIACSRLYPQQALGN